MRTRTRQDLDWWPRPPDLDVAPELAVLAAVRAALSVTIPALLAANPELTDAESPRPHPICAVAARRIIDDAYLLRDSIDDYRAIIDALRAPDPPASPDDIPF